MSGESITTGQRRVLGVAALAALVLAAGCGGGESRDADPAGSASASAGASGGPEAKAKREARDAYFAFWKAQTRAYARASTKGTGVTKYTAGEAYAQLLEDVAQLRAKGDRVRARKGAVAPRHDVLAVTVTPRRADKVASAEIRDCLDISDWQTVNTKTDKVYPLPEKQPPQAITTATAEDWGRQGWVIIKVTPSTTACGA